jgi:hypothetical protein
VTDRAHPAQRIVHRLGVTDIAVHNS